MSKNYYCCGCDEDMDSLMEIFVLYYNEEESGSYLKETSRKEAQKWRAIGIQK